MTNVNVRGRNLVWVAKSGGYKSDCTWECSSEYEAEIMANWLCNMGLSATYLDLTEFDKLPEVHND